MPAARDGGSYNSRRTQRDASSDLEMLGKSRENLAARRRHHDHVFMPDAAEPRIVKSRLNREHLSIFQRHFLKPRIFMNLQPQTAAGAMATSNVLAFAD